MTDKTHASAGDGFEEAVATGRFDGDWYTEEFPGATRLGIRVNECLHEERSSYQKIAVYGTTFFGKLLAIDDVVMLTERDEFVYHEMLTHVPLCSLVDPKAVLIIGGGDCGCMREVLRHPSVERVVQCEIDERVTRVCQDHFPWVEPTLADPRVETIFDDGAAYMEGHQGAFDLVIIDSTDPVGAALPLFQEPFYRQVARALKPTGVMTAQTESPHWTPNLVGAIFREQRRAFEHVHGYLGHIPTYQSGVWSWSYASNGRRPGDDFDRERALSLADGCRYYNAGIQTAAFALPNFARQAMAGEDPFPRFRPQVRRPASD